MPSGTAKKKKNKQNKMIVFTDPSRNHKRIRKIEICQQN